MVCLKFQFCQVSLSLPVIMVPKWIDQICGSDWWQVVVTGDSHKQVPYLLKLCELTLNMLHCWSYLGFDSTQQHMLSVPHWCWCSGAFRSIMTSSLWVQSSHGLKMAFVEMFMKKASFIAYMATFQTSILEGAIEVIQQSVHCQCCVTTLVLWSTTVSQPAAKAASLVWLIRQSWQLFFDTNYWRSHVWLLFWLQKITSHAFSIAAFINSLTKILKIYNICQSELNFIFLCMLIFIQFFILFN